MAVVVGQTMTHLSDRTEIDVFAHESCWAVLAGGGGPDEGITHERPRRWLGSQVRTPLVAGVLLGRGPLGGDV